MYYRSIYVYPDSNTNHEQELGRNTKLTVVISLSYIIPFCSVGKNTHSTFTSDIINTYIPVIHTFPPNNNLLIFTYVLPKINHPCRSCFPIPFHLSLWNSHLCPCPVFGGWRLVILACRCLAGTTVALLGHGRRLCSWGRRLGPASSKLLNNKEYVLERWSSVKNFPIKQRISTNIN